MTDRETHREEDVDKRLERLGRETIGIRPSAGFTSRVMRSIEPERKAAWLVDTPRLGWRFLPVAALAAVVAMAWAIRSESALEDALATSADAVELEW